jgi:N-sulfoglucosamine sulfohydrolase
MMRGMLAHPVRAALAALLLAPSALATPAAAQREDSKRPNIIWLVLDDASPALGSYGDPQAITPNMDRLAREGARFTRAFTHTPVCAPSRFGLVTGMYPTTAGAHHMRSLLINPPTTFMHMLRASGYFVAWPGKVDFNFDPGGLSALPEGAADSTAQWRNGPPPKQPFFAYLNLGVTHEAQVRGDAQLHAKNTARLKPSEFHDPAKMHVPAFLPDAPEVRKDLAQFYDLMTAADYTVGDVLDWLEKNRLSDHTIVFLFGDHGTGMPRSKRWVYDSGIKVPLVIRWPGHIAPNSVRDDLVSFIDFAPTVLSLAGVEIPRTMQGQVFLGDKRAKEREYIFATRDRMDETFDRIRGVRDKQFQYIRNFHPELPYAQVNAYNEQNPTMRVWRQLHAEGKLTGAPEAFFAPTKPREELYDTDADPDEIHNLASDPKYKKTLERMRAALDTWIKETKDLGEVPEEELERRGILRHRAGP